MTPGAKFRTVGEVAERLRVGDRTVRWLIRSGQLAALRVGEEFLIDTHDLAAFIRTSAIRPDTGAGG